MKTLSFQAPCGILTGRVTAHDGDCSAQQGRADRQGQGGQHGRSMQSHNSSRHHVTVFNIPYATGDPFGAPIPVTSLIHEGVRRQAPAADQVLTITAPCEYSAPHNEASSQDQNTPASTTFQGNVDSPKYPILIWIHGGAYEHGHPSEPWCDAGHFAGAGIVTVSLGYRKRFEGFWQDRPAKPFAPRAIDDLVAALDWVYLNAPTFGGDTSNITLTGQSAGAGLALALASDPRTSGRIHRMIAMSPAFSIFHGSAFRRRIVAHSLGSGKDASVAQLAATSPKQREKAWSQLRRLLPIDPAVGVKADSFAPTIPTIVTTTSEEFFFVPLLRKLDRLPGKRIIGRALARAFRGTGRFPTRTTEQYGSRPCASVVSDSTIRSNALTVAERCLASGVPIWTAQFRPGAGLGTGPDGKPTSGAPHCVELPRFFGREPHHPFHDIVIQFVRSGTTRLPAFDNARLTTEFSGADAHSEETVNTDVWAAPRQLFGLRN